MNILSKNVENAFYNEMEKVAGRERAVTFISSRVGKWLGAAQKTVPKFSGEIGALKNIWHGAMTPDLTKHIPKSILNQGVNVVGGINRKLKSAQSGAGAIGAAVSAVGSGAQKVGNIANVLNKPVSGTKTILNRFSPSIADKAYKSKTLSQGLNQLQKRRGY